MTNAPTTFKGVVHGKLIELETAPELPDGQSVAITVQPISSPTEPLAAGEGIRRSAGAWNDDSAGLDEYLEQIRQLRDLDRSPIRA